MKAHVEFSEQELQALVSIKCPEGIYVPPANDERPDAAENACGIKASLQRAQQQYDAAQQAALQLEQAEAPQDAEGIAGQLGQQQGGEREAENRVVECDAYSRGICHTVDFKSLDGNVYEVSLRLSDMEKMTPEKIDAVIRGKLDVLIPKVDPNCPNCFFLTYHERTIKGSNKHPKATSAYIKRTLFGRQSEDVMVTFGIEPDPADGGGAAVETELNDGSLTSML